MVVVAAGRRPGLDRARRPEAAVRFAARRAGDPGRRAGRPCRRSGPDVPHRLWLRSALALGRGTPNGRLRGRVAAQDQRHERLCGLARLVELLLPPHPQPSGPGRLAGLQRRHRALADGARHLCGVGADPEPFRRRGGRLARRHRGGSRDQQTTRPLAARHRIQAGSPLRHQPGRHRRHGARDPGGTLGRRGAVW